MGSRRNIVVLGLDDWNRELLHRVPDADRYEFHGLLTIAELQVGDIPIVDLLRTAEKKLAAFDGPIDAIIGFWDFPVSTIVPLLCRRFDVRGPSLEAVLRCEHKYWSRLEQRKAITELPPFALVDLDDARPPGEVGYPFWLKPVKSFSSDLAFEVTDEQEFTRAVTEMRDGVARVGEPFEYVLAQAELPPEIAAAGGQSALAEQAMTGERAAVEGYCHGGEVVVHGVLDSLVYPGVSSFLRHQYPSRLPSSMVRRLTDVSTRVIEHIGLTDTTFSIEYFCDPTTGDVGLLEINPRHSQTHADLFEQVDGFPNHHYLIKAALGEDPGRPKGGGPYDISAHWYLRRFDDGVVRRVPSTSDIARVEREIDGVRVRVKVGEGQRLSEMNFQDSYSYQLAEMVVGARDVAEMEEKYRRCVAALPFVFEEV
ncbi:acetyl-CoA carboxylase biotin carboxylase subunit family protein [Actinophytocola sp. NPDC049390]|uniref:acetyl-CoA carboxylase biotin carboxylase subunit family protein n=1 Tax=Actinophytocola sp. NPDC049390 TaxID=3363894 RepID=UPI0037AFB249